MIYARHITVDLYDDRITEVETQQGDTARALEITVTMDGEQLTPAPGTRVNFRGRKPDGYGIDNPATITEQNTIRYQFTEQTVAYPGRFPCDIYFVQTDGTLSTVTFWLIVKPHPTGKPGTSSYEYGAMVDATNKALEAAGDASGAAGEASAAASAATEAAGLANTAAQAAGEATEKANTAAGRAETATETANTAAGAANTAAAAANAAAGDAGAAADKANTAAGNADAATEKANAAAQDASEAATAADGATDRANTAAGLAESAADGANTAAGAAQEATDAANAAAQQATGAAAEADAATDEALEAAEQARQAAQTVLGEIDGVVLLSLDTQQKYIMRFRISDGCPAIQVSKTIQAG